MISAAPNTAPSPSTTPFRIADRARWIAWGDAGPYRPGYLPIPVRRGGAVQLAYFEIYHPWAVARETAEAAERKIDLVTPPLLICYGDPVSGRLIERVTVDWNEERPGNPKAHFGLPRPTGPGAHIGDTAPIPVIGHFSDPKWLPKDRVELLRKRIHEDLDVLLPYFADTSRPWTEEASKAAREVRDFFPIASEPGLWPYYRAEGKDFFPWLEKNAPPGKSPLPWDPGAP